jgi:hypothetical protein
MASRGFDRSKRKRVEAEEEDVETSDESLEEEEVSAKSSETVQLVLLRDLKLKYTGPVTGKLYVFSGAGAVVDVDEEDAVIMLEKRGGTCCEGSGTGQPPKYFDKL